MRILPILVGLALLLWMLLGAWWMSTNRADCLGEKTVTNTPIEENISTAEERLPDTSPLTTDDAFVISDGSFNASAPQGIRFGLSNNMPVMSTPTGTALENLATYLSGNADRQLTLVGKYRADEENTTNFLNLGLARAGAVKERLVTMGAAANRIDLSGLQIEDGEVRNDTLLNGIDFRFKALETLDSDEAITTLRSTILAEPAIIYFATASANVNLEETFRTKVQNLKTYLRAVGDATVTVSGHTDNVGNVASNTTLSERRAAQIKDYLTQQGFDRDRISDIS